MLAGPLRFPVDHIKSLDSRKLLDITSLVKMKNTISKIPTATNNYTYVYNTYNKFTLTQYTTTIWYLHNSTYIYIYNIHVSHVCSQKYPSERHSCLTQGVGPKPTIQTASISFLPLAERHPNSSENLEDLEDHLSPSASSQSWAPKRQR